MKMSNFLCEKFECEKSINSNICTNKCEHSCQSFNTCNNCIKKDNCSRYLLMNKTI